MLIKSIKIKNKEGITLIALVITIIVLLILAGISIATLTGENGILAVANKAKEQTEIGKEKEQLKIAITEVIGFNENGLNQTNLQNILDKNLGEEKAVVTYDEEERILYVKFVDSERVYKIDKNGEVTYIGKENELILETIIEIEPESSTTPELFQIVEVKTTIPMKVEDSKYSLEYAWSRNKNEMPKDEEFIDSNATGTGRTKEAIISSTDTVEGNYYIWIRVGVGGRNKTECFGPYAIKDHTTLIATIAEETSKSGFLGNEEIQRGKIKRVNIVGSLEGHKKEEDNTWDVTQSQNGKYLAWYEKDDKGYYSVTIGGKEGVVANSNSSYLFNNIGSEIEDEEVKIEGLENLDTGLVINMRCMFENCKNIKTLNINKFDTSNVTNMQNMFSGCESLTQIDVSNFDTSKVTNMSLMFYSSSNLNNLNLSNFNTNNVLYLNRMFQSCSSLTQLDLSNFNTKNVTNIAEMFSGCLKITKIDIKNFNTSQVIDMHDMFYNCLLLSEVDVSKFDTSNVTNMQKMFSGCESLTQIDVSNFDTSNVTNMQKMFSECKSLTQIDVSDFNTGNVTDMSYMFYSCSNLKEIDLNNFNTSNVINMASMFHNCSNLINLDLNSYDTRQVTNMENMFAYCSSLINLNLNNFDTSNVNNIMNMFIGISKLTVLELNKFNITKITNYDNLFRFVPTTVTIYTNQPTSNWIKEKFPTYTNITIIN